MYKVFDEVYDRVRRAKNLRWNKFNVQFVLLLLNVIYAFIGSVVCLAYHSNKAAGVLALLAMVCFRGLWSMTQPKQVGNTTYYACWSLVPNSHTGHVYTQVEDYQVWMVEGVIHREDGPAFIDHHQNRMLWKQKDECHRLDGPAVVYPDGGKSWDEYWYKGEEFSKEQWSEIPEVKHTLLKNKLKMVLSS